MKDLHHSHPGVEDLRARAHRRLPRFVIDYLEGGTGRETALARNRAALDRVLLLPRGLAGEPAPQLETEFLGRRWQAPFGVAPVGMAGLVWPGAEAMIARAATAAGLPYTLSTVAAATPEEIGPETDGRGWFQLYPPRDPEIRDDILRRARRAGFEVLVLTIDVPVMSRRERQRRAGIRMPFRPTPRLLAQITARPAWALAMLRAVARGGAPRLALMERYTAAGGANTVTRADHALRTAPDRAYLEALRERWTGPLVVKGVLDPELAAILPDAGVDAVWVSNHGGRQFDATPAAIDLLPQVRAALGAKVPIVLDSGVVSALDILRAMAMGADFVMLGRPWHWAVAAFGEAGAAYLAELLMEDMKANLAQLGITHPADASTRLYPPPGQGG